jgi:hypothetical protein
MCHCESVTVGMKILLSNWPAGLPVARFLTANPTANQSPKPAKLAKLLILKAKLAFVPQSTLSGSE